MQIQFQQWSKKGERKMRFDRYLLLSRKRALVITCVWALSVLLHKAMYGPFDAYLATKGALAAEAALILGTVIIPIYSMISLVYTAVRRDTSEMGCDKYLLLSWKRVLAIPAAWALSVLLHNAIYALFYDHFSGTGGDEAIFFVLAIPVIPLYFVVAFLYTVVRHVGGLVRGKPR